MSGGGCMDRSSLKSCAGTLQATKQLATSKLHLQLHFHKIGELERAGGAGDFGGLGPAFEE